MKISLSRKLQLLNFSYFSLFESLLDKGRKENKVIENSQKGFTKGKSGVTTMTGLCDKITWLAKEGREVDAICFSQ